MTVNPPTPHAPLRLKVYSVNPTTGVRRTIREETLIPGAQQADSYSLGRFPPCACLRCRKAKAGAVR